MCGGGGGGVSSIIIYEYTTRFLVRAHADDLILLFTYILVIYYLMYIYIHTFQRGIYPISKIAFPLFAFRIHRGARFWNTALPQAGEMETIKCSYNSYSRHPAATWTDKLFNWRHFLWEDLCMCGHVFA